MADMMSTLKGFLGDNADEKIKGAMEMLKSSGMLEGSKSTDSNFAEKLEDSIDVSENKPENKPQTGFPAITPEGLEMMGQIKNMFDQMTNSNDQRSNLLMSLKPFMRTERQRSIDRVTKLMNIARFSGLFRK